MPPVINKDMCTRCGQCVEACPTDVFWGSKKKQTPIVSYGEECWHCSACIQECPKEGAIRLRIPMPAMLLYK